MSGDHLDFIWRPGAAGNVGPWVQRLAAINFVLDEMGREFDRLPVVPISIAMREALQPDTSPLSELLERMR